VNVDPLPISEEINKEEKEHDRVAGDYASEKKISLLTVMEKKQKKIHALMQGQTIPFKAFFAIRVWDKSKDGLNAKSGAIKNAINSMNSAQYFESNLGRLRTSQTLFRAPFSGGHAAGVQHLHRAFGHRRVPTSFIKGLLAIATSAWRAKAKMIDSTTGEPRPEMARVYKDIERIYRHLEEIGFTIKNHTGDPYDDGQPMKVITSQPRQDANRKYVLETLLPTIYWNDRIIQHGEIEIAIPANLGHQPST
jgi:hypothetical protein